MYTEKNTVHRSVLSFTIVMFCSPVIVGAELHFPLLPVLPKFEVKVNVPQTVAISDEEFPVDACAKYVFMWEI